MKKNPVFILIFIAVLLLFIQCPDSGGKDDSEDDPAEELYGSWQTVCLSDGGGGSFRISMTFASGGDFSRDEYYYDDDTCSVAAAPAGINFDKSFTWVGETADPSVKKLKYIDESDAVVYALYKIDGGVLYFAEDDTAYPADLTGALQLE